jgi:hypothetical protein
MTAFWKVDKASTQPLLHSLFLFPSRFLIELGKKHRQVKSEFFQRLMNTSQTTPNAKPALHGVKIKQRKVRFSSMQMEVFFLPPPISPLCTF